MRLPSSEKYQNKKLGWFGSDTRDIAMFQVPSPILRCSGNALMIAPNIKQNTTLALIQVSTRQTNGFVENSSDAGILLGGRFLPSTAALCDLMMHFGK